MSVDAQANRIARKLAFEVASVMREAEERNQLALTTLDETLAEQLQLLVGDTSTRLTPMTYIDRKQSISVSVRVQDTAAPRDIPSRLTRLIQLEASVDALVATAQRTRQDYAHRKNTKRE